MERSSYFHSLPAEAKERYTKKLSLMGGSDPYCMKQHDLMQNIGDLPLIRWVVARVVCTTPAAFCSFVIKIFAFISSFPDIMIYLIFTTSFATLDEVRNYKSLASYKYFTAGWVLSVSWAKIGSGLVLAMGKVRHSYSSSLAPVNPWVLLQHTGTIVCGHCTCMAGLGETCSHVGAVLYWLETRVRIREEATSTSQENAWIVPKAVPDTPYLPLYDIDFTTAEKRMKGTNDDHSTNLSSNLLPPSHDEMSTFFSEISKEDEKRPIILSLISPYSDAFQSSADHLPQQLQLLYNSKYLEFDYITLLKLSTDFISELSTATASQQHHLEEMTRIQARSKDWFKYRAGRITASRFYQITHTNPHMPSLSLIQSVCYPQFSQFSNTATTYGCTHEKDAIEAYKHNSTMHHDCMSILLCGFVVSLERQYNGASPDAFLECKCCGQGVLEVKCPLCAMQHSTLELTSETVKSFCLVKGDSGSLQLNQEHPYYSSANYSYMQPIETFVTLLFQQMKTYMLRG